MFLGFLSRWRWEIALAGAVLFSAAVLTVAEVGHDRTLQAHERITSVSEDSQAVLQLMVLLTDAETGQRGYLLTKQESYLDIYRAGVNGSKLILQTLVQRYNKAGDTAGLLRVGRIATTAGEKFSELEIVVRYAQQGDMEQALSIVNADIGRNRMIELRTAVEALLHHNRTNANRLRQESIEISKYARIGVAITVSINLALLVVVFLRLGESWRKKEQEAEQLKLKQDWLDAQVRDRTAQLEQLSIHLQDVIEGEKIRLARHLHDELGSVLTAAKMDVAWVRSKLRRNPGEMDERLKRTLENIDQGILVGRRLIEDLRPSTLTSFGLVVAARELAENCAARNEWSLDLDLPDSEPDIDPDTATALYRVLQEALANAAKHAQANSMSIKLACSDHALRLEIADDGVGFRLREAPLKALGLAGMRQRLQARGGTLDIVTQPGEGCRIVVTLPLDRNKARNDTPENSAQDAVGPAPSGIPYIDATLPA